MGRGAPPVPDAERSGAVRVRVHLVAAPADPGELVLRHGPLLDGVERGLRLREAARARHDEVDARVRQHEAIAVARAREANVAGLAAKRAEERAPARRGEGDDAGPR